MAITDLAKAVERNVPWRTCTVCYELGDLPPAQAAALRSLLANPAVRYTELSQALAADQDFPLRIKAGALARHARGGCDADEALRA